MQNFKISIITVCLNSEKTVEQTIQNVIEQSYTNIEYIIIDGGSTDGTIDIIRKYEAYIAYWVSEKDYGIYDAINKGIKKATGDIVGIINSDDWYEENAFFRVATYFYEHPEIEVVYGDLVVVSETGEQKLEKGIDPKVETAGDWYATPTVFIKRCVYEKYGMYDLRYSILADGAYMLKLKYNNVLIGKIPYVLAFFRLGGACNTSRYRWKRIVEMKSIMERAMEQTNVTLRMKIEMEQRLDRYRQNELLKYALSRMMRTNKGHYEILLNRLLDLNGKEAFLLWGTGDDGSQIGTLFGDYIQLIHAYVDSDKNKEGTIFHGKSVLRPDEVSRKWLVVITTRKYNNQIQKWLIDRGFKWGTDFITFNDFIYHLIIGAFPKLFSINNIRHDCICKSISS